MTKNLQRIAATLLFLSIPQTIDNGYSPQLKKIEYLENIKATEKELTNARYHLIEINERIESVESIREFIMMRLNEKDIIDSMKNDYLRKLNKTNTELRKYYHKKDSIYKIIKK
jgi:hypothetical protein